MSTPALEDLPPEAFEAKIVEAKSNIRSFLDDLPSMREELDARYVLEIIDDATQSAEAARHVVNSRLDRICSEGVIARTGTYKLKFHLKCIEQSLEKIGQIREDCLTQDRGRVRQQQLHGVVPAAAAAAAGTWAGVTPNDSSVSDGSGKIEAAPAAVPREVSVKGDADYDADTVMGGDGDSNEYNITGKEEPESATEVGVSRRSEKKRKHIPRTESNAADLHFDTDRHYSNGGAEDGEDSKIPKKISGGKISSATKHSKANGFTSDAAIASASQRGEIGGGTRRASEFRQQQVSLGMRGTPVHLCGICSKNAFMKGDAAWLLVTYESDKVKASRPHLRQHLICFVCREPGKDRSFEIDEVAERLHGKTPFLGDEYYVRASKVDYEKSAINHGESLYGAAGQEYDASMDKRLRLSKTAHEIS